MKDFLIEAVGAIMAIVLCLYSIPLAIGIFIAISFYAYSG